MKKTLALILLITVVVAVLISCKKDEEAKPLKVGLVLSFGTISDKGFNQMAYEGLLLADKELNMDWEIKESCAVAEISSNIAYFAANKFDVIITLGFDASQPTLDAANAHPEIKFVLLDASFANLPANLACVTYQIDQVSFPAGFLAAYWANQTDPTDAKVGNVAGPEIPPILQFTESFAAGVAYFNNQYTREVTLNKVHATDFNDTLQGANLAASLIQGGADVLFACAGTTGNGALYQAKNSGIGGIGVDTDQYFTIPDVGDILLTSCMKRLDQSIYSELIAIGNKQFHGGTTSIGNLTNNGVELAPFHNFETQIPDSIKTALAGIRQGIISGTINTGWN
jgi:basic membrane protein A and related proteins